MRNGTYSFLSVDLGSDLGINTIVALSLDNLQQFRRFPEQSLALLIPRLVDDSKRFVALRVGLDIRSGSLKRHLLVTDSVVSRLVSYFIIGVQIKRIYARILD